MNRITAARRHKRQRLEALGPVAIPSPFVRVVVEHGMTHRLSMTAQEHFTPPKHYRAPTIVTEAPAALLLQRTG